MQLSENAVSHFPSPQQFLSTIYPQLKVKVEPKIQYNTTWEEQLTCQKYMMQYSIKQIQTKIFHRIEKILSRINAIPQDIQTETNPRVDKIIIGIRILRKRITGNLNCYHKAKRLKKRPVENVYTVEGQAIKHKIATN